MVTGPAGFPYTAYWRSGNLLGQETALLPQYRLTPTAGSLECGNRAHSAVIAFTFYSLKKDFKGLKYLCQAEYAAGRNRVQVSLCIIQGSLVFPQLRIGLEKPVIIKSVYLCRDPKHAFKIVIL